MLEISKRIAKLYSNPNKMICSQFYRWYVRVFDGNDSSKEGWVPASILDAQQMDNAIYGDRVDDAAYRRSYENLFFFSLH